MKRVRGPLRLLLGLFVGILSAIAWAEPTPAADGGRPRSLPAADVQDLVFLGPMRPLLLRLHVTIDGKPFRQAWQERFDELFALEDRDHSGRLTLDAARSLARDMNGSLRDEPKAELKAEPNLKSPSDAQEAAGADSGMDRVALLAYLDGNLPAFVVHRRAVIARGAALALFPLLDTDHNHQLSADELGAAEEQLKQRDFNDDGAITRGELILDPNAIAAAADPAGAEHGLDPQDGPVMLVGASTSGAQIAEKLLQHYDRNHDGRLTPAAPELEISLPVELMGRFDTNGDGVLDREELDKFADRPSDLELFFALGRATVGDSRRRQQAPSDPAFRVRKTLRNGYELDLGEAQVRLDRENRDPRQADLVNFRDFDRDKNDYIDLSEAGANNIGRAAFAMMDADGDGKVFKGEFTSFVDRQNAAAALRLQLAVSDFGQDLFDMLDADSDGILSARELRHARDILAAADKNGDGSLNGDEVPQQVDLELARGVDDRAETTKSHHATSTAKAGSSGPLWFRKMDRNNDGDVSRREFIGPLSAFEKLDADHDGLVDRQEAEAAGK